MKVAVIRKNIKFLPDSSRVVARYFMNEKWAAKVGAQFLFTEYKSSIKVQQFPQENDRFRNKSLLLCVGVSYKF